jgi:hypothetical protein
MLQKKTAAACGCNHNDACCVLYWLVFFPGGASVWRPVYFALYCFCAGENCTVWDVAGSIQWT